MSDTGNTFFVRDRGRILGPFTIDELRALRTRGQLGRFHQVSRDKQSWVAADTLKEIFTHSRALQKREAGASPGVEEGTSATAASWYYNVGDEAIGPVPQVTLVDLLSRGALPPDTMAWREGMADWIPVSSVAELAPACLNGGLISTGPADSDQPTQPRRRLKRRILLASLLFFVAAGAGTGGWYFYRFLDPFVRGVQDEARISRALGLVVCGWTLNFRDGRSIDVPASTGTCFAVTPDGYFLTNSHVVEDTFLRQRMVQAEFYEDLLKNLTPRLAQEDMNPQQIRAKILDSIKSVEPRVWVLLGSRYQVFDAEILHLSEVFDMAILKLPIHRSPYFRFAPLDKPPARTQPVFALGFPGSAMHAISREEVVLDLTRKLASITSVFRSRDYAYTLTSGIVSKVSVEETGRQWIQHTATISQGNSGGPLVDDSGRLLGINTLLTKGDDDSSATQYAAALPQMVDELRLHIPSL